MKHPLHARQNETELARHLADAIDYHSGENDVPIIVSPGDITTPSFVVQNEAGKLFRVTVEEI